MGDARGETLGARCDQLFFADFFLVGRSSDVRFRTTKLKSLNFKLVPRFNMKNIKILFLIIFISLFFNKSIAADLYFVDIKQILNKSKAGKKAQTFLKNLFFKLVQI